MTEPLIDLRAHWAPPAVHDTVGDVIAERIAQDFRWGEQNHPLIREQSASWAQRKLYEAEANHYKGLNDYLAAKGLLGWDSILLEEVFEALSEEDPDNQYTELIQVAAVALNAAQSIRRNAKEKK